MRIPTDSVMMPQELQMMTPPIKSETRGSASRLPVKATMIPATTTPNAETASPSMWR